MNFRTTEMPVSSCPRCGKTCDQASSLGGHSPKEGDVTVCIDCRAVLVFGADMELEFATSDVVEEVTLELSRVQNALRTIKG